MIYQNNAWKDRLLLRRIYVDTAMIGLLCLCAGILMGYVLAKVWG